MSVHEAEAASFSWRHRDSSSRLDADRDRAESRRARWRCRRDRRRRHRRRRHRPERTRSRRLGDRRDDAICRRSSRGSSSPTIDGRYLIPDLPKASYNVWVRGYGLVDSPKQWPPRPGTRLNLTAVAAPNPHAAAQFYPGRLLVLAAPGARQERVPRHRATGNGISPNMKSQADWIRNHQVGRLHGVSPARHQRHARDSDDARRVQSSTAAWERRIQSGQAGAQMIGRSTSSGGSARWRCSPTGPIASPPAKCPPAPPRPQGLERNVVITEWDWADPKAYLHDEVSTDRRNPRVNANGLIYGSLELSADYPAGARSGAQHDEPRAADGARSERRRPRRRRRCRSRRRTGATRRSGRARTTSTTRCSTSRAASGSRRRSVRRANPDFCKAGSTHPSAKLFPLARSGRQLAMYDPKTKKLTHISTCFSTHHLMFAEDANNTLWTSGGGDGAVGSAG